MVGIAYLFVNYCSNGDLNSWLRKHKEKYIGNTDTNTLINKMTKHLACALSDSHNEYHLPEVIDVSFDNYDLLFFCYQIARGNFCKKINYLKYLLKNIIKVWNI